MLNPFPIQYLAILAYFLLRITVAFILIHTGGRLLGSKTPFVIAHYTTPLPFGYLRTFALGEIVLGILFFFGAYTQIAALVTGFFVCILFGAHRLLPSHFIPSKSFLILFFVVLCSLFITGGGAFSFDLPI